MSDVPRWREDFPIRWEADHYTTRREFTKFLVLTSGATFVGHSYFLLAGLREERTAYPTVEIASVSEVPVGGVKLFRYPTPSDPAILIRLKEDEWAAYLQRCTHLSCPVHFSRKTGRIECPCHNGVFDAATGQVLAGPPPRPLPRIALHIANGKIFAQGMQES